ncbi:MAG: hypothetical protein ACRDSJ_12000, partial [Rubrobacteraceae bacterium]
VLKRARIRALEEDTSVNALVREFLESYADERTAREAREEALRDLKRIARESKASSGGKGLPSREETYEERTRWPRS